MSVWFIVHTYAEDVETETLVSRLVDQLVWEAVEAHMTRQGQWTHIVILQNTHSTVTNHILQHGHLIRCFSLNRWFSILSLVTPKLMYICNYHY